MCSRPFKKGADDQERGKNIAAAIHENPERLIAECEEHMAYAGNNYLPFLLNPYQTQRPLLLNCIELLNLESSTVDSSLTEAIQFILQNRIKKWLSIINANLNLNWVPENGVN